MPLTELEPAFSDLEHLCSCSAASASDRRDAKEAFTSFPRCHQGLRGVGEAPRGATDIYRDVKRDLETVRDVAVQFSMFRFLGPALRSSEVPDSTPP